MAITGNWIGDLFGTIRGNLYVEFSDVGGRNEITLRFGSGGAATVLTGDVTGVAAGDNRVITGNNNGPVILTVHFDTVEQGSILGRWSLADGNAGTFQISRVETATPQQAATNDPIRLGPALINGVHTRAWL